MGGDGILIQIIVLGAVALFLILRLRSVLGRRTGEEKRPPNPFGAPPARGGVERDNVVTLPDRPRHKNADDVGPDVAGVEPGGPMSLAGALTQLKIADSGFDEKYFLQGARAAFKMIVEGFAKGERDMLRALLDDGLYRTFESDIAAREAEGRTRETEVLRVRDADIAAVRLDGSVAYVTVDFRSDQIDVTRDRDGQIVEGDPDRAIEVQDRWTFSRDTQSSNPNWALVETHVVE